MPLLWLYNGQLSCHDKETQDSKMKVIGIYYVNGWSNNGGRLYLTSENTIYGNLLTLLVYVFYINAKVTIC